MKFRQERRVWGEFSIHLNNATSQQKAGNWSPSSHLLTDMEKTRAGRLESELSLRISWLSPHLLQSKHHSVAGRRRLLRGRPSFSFTSLYFHSPKKEQSLWVCRHHQVGVHAGCPTGRSELTGPMFCPYMGTLNAGTAHAVLTMGCGCHAAVD